MTVALRPYLPADAPALASIAADAIEVLAAEDYDEGQRAAWLESLERDFDARLARALTLIATVGGTPVGFAALADNTRLDLLYVDPQAARQGVANTLCDALEKLAAGRGAAEIKVDASDTAKPLFEERGYAAERRNTVPLGEEWLATTTMRKKLPANENA